MTAELKLPRRSRRVTLAAVALGAWFGALLFIFGNHNDFPLGYHPDETSKGWQIIGSDLNFHHPLLLLDGAKLLLRASGLPRSPENGVLCGRWASAVFAALSVVFLAVLAARRGGWKAGVLCALLVPVHPLLFELAHYCKEDPALLCGLSLSLLAFDVFHARPSLGTAAFLGSACGLAVSGKYLGIVMLLIAIPFVAVAARRAARGRLALSAVLFGTFFAVVLALNLPFFVQPRALGFGLGYELKLVQAGGSKGLTKGVPHSKYVTAFLENVGWPLRLGLLAFAASLILRRRKRALQSGMDAATAIENHRATAGPESPQVCPAAWRRLVSRTAPDVLLLCLPLGYAAMLSFSPKGAGRYFLAVSPVLITAGAIGLARVADWIRVGAPRWLRCGALPALAVAAFVSQVQLTRETYAAFATDSRREMAAWMVAALPPHSVVLAESRIFLDRPTTWPNDRPAAFEIRPSELAADFGTLEELRAKGIQYVVVNRTTYGGFLSKQRRAAANRQSDYDRRRTFYERLFTEGKLLKRAGGTYVEHLNPDLRLFQIQ